MSFSSVRWKLIRSSDVSQWTAHTADQLSTEGDDVYLKAFQEQTIPETETINLADIFTRSSTLVSQRESL